MNNLVRHIGHQPSLILASTGRAQINLIPVGFMGVVYPEYERHHSHRGLARLICDPHQDRCIIVEAIFLKFSAQSYSLIKMIFARSGEF